VFAVISCICNNKNISKNKEETTIVYYFHSLSGAILNFVDTVARACPFAGWMHDGIEIAQEIAQTTGLFTRLQRT
jgi:hypothetical protein